MHWVAAFLIATPETSSRPATEEAVIITGERARRTSKETGSSHEVFGTTDLDRSGVSTVEEFLSLIPNVQAGSLGTAPAIRGLDGTGAVRDLPAFTAGVTPRTALLIDGREAGYFEMIFGDAPLWDVRQLEVFRGPQMVTQGRNAIAGAIFVTTRDPTFEREVRGRLLAGNYGLRGSALAASGPINDQVATRFSAEWRGSRPFTDIGDNMRGASPDKLTHFIGRSKILIEPANLPWLQLRMGYHHVQSRSPQSQQAILPYRDRKNPAASFGIFDISVDALTVQADFKLANEWKAAFVLTGGKNRTRRFAPPNLGEARVGINDRSIETRVERDTERSRLAFGVYWQDEHTDQWIDVSRLAGVGTFRQRRTSLGIFSEVERKVGDITASAALRLQYDRQRRIGGFSPALPNVDLDFDLRTTSLLPRISLAWDVSPSWRIGALLQHATAPGGGYLPLTLGSEGRFKKEGLTDFEIFVRGNFDEGRGSFNLNAFKYWMTDQQRSFPRAVRIPGVPVFILAEITNLPKSTVRGLESNIRWAVRPSLTLTAAVGLLDSEVIKSEGNSGVAVGNRLARSPTLSGNAGIEWTPPGGWLASVRIGGRSGYYSDDANIPERRVKGHWSLDARLEKTFKNIRLFAYGRNLLNKFGVNFYPSDVAAELADPRQIGVGVDFEF